MLGGVLELRFRPAEMPERSHLPSLSHHVASLLEAGVSDDVTALGTKSNQWYADRLVGHRCLRSNVSIPYLMLFAQPGLVDRERRVKC